MHCSSREGRSRWAALSVVTIALSVGAAWVTAQVPRTLMDFGEPVYPAFEGWYQNADGTYSLLVGYFNPNAEQALDVPVGENNYFSPGPQDVGQPTHFGSGRHWGVFTVTVPADFGDQELTWHLTTNNETVSIPMHLQAPYYVEPFRDAANENEPPTIKSSPNDEGHTGPPTGIWQTLTATAGTPLEVSIWTTDVKPTLHVRERAGRFRRPPLVVRYEKLRGPGEVEFADEELEFEDSSDQNPTTTATFSEPGEYVIRIEALDETGEGGSGFQCCWTSVHVKVSVS